MNIIVVLFYKQIPICELKDDELWEAMQRHHQQQQHHQHQHHQHLLCDRMSTQHNCVQCHQVKQDQQCPVCISHNLLENFN